MMLLALYLSFAVPAGAILYWIYGNVLAIGILYLMNVIINPKKHIDYEALENSRILLAKAEAGKKSKKEHKDELRRSKADYKRFFADDDVKKEVVFYSSAAGTHKYFKGVIEKILSESNIVIHYVTSNLKDNVFEMVDHPRFIPYYIEGTNLIYFFMKLDAVLMVMTMPEFHTYSYKRSIVQKDIEYIYLFHGVLSPNLIYKKGALDHYDTIFCTGPSQFEELRLEEEMRGIKPRKLIQGGYSLIDDTIAAYQHKAQQESGHRPEILIAPSWHEQNILDVCIDELLNAILGKGYHITLRPHPEYIRRYNHRMQALISRYQGVPAEELTFESDHSSNESVFSADVLITDWSTICFEYSFATLRPTLFIETPMKIMNPDYQELGNVPLEIRSRTDMGRSVDPENMQEVDTSIQDFLANKESYQERIQKVIDYALYNVGTSAEVEADYIISRVLSHRGKRGAAK
jgi:YidC/Oxa1 family membrane protein insertase